MSRLLALLIIVCSSPFYLSAQENTLPSIEIRTLNGKAENTSSITNDGKPIILCIWEVACKPCIQEFDNMTKKYIGWQQETGVKIVAISVDDNRNYLKVAPLVKSKGWPFEFYQDKNQDVKRALGVSVCPFTAVVDGKGELVWRKAGYMQGDEDIAFEVVRKVLKGEKVD
jgi:peroxiredoxin